MSESTILWIFGILVTINSGIVGILFMMLWGHIRDCRRSGDERSAMLATLQAQQRRIMEDIGTHDTGLRGDLHSLRSFVTPMALWVQSYKEDKSR